MPEQPEYARVRIVTLNKALAYLGRQPYGDVAPIINELQSTTSVIAPTAKAEVEEKAEGKKKSAHAKAKETRQATPEEAVDANTWEEPVDANT